MPCDSDHSPFQAIPVTNKVPSLFAKTPVLPAPTFNCSVTVAVVALIVAPVVGSIWE